MTNEFVGSRYEATRNLDIAEVAKLVRVDLRDLGKRGFKCAVRISRYSGGQSLKVEVKTVPDGFSILNQARVAWEQENPNQCCTHLGWLSDEATKVRDEIEAILAAYNQDKSDPMTDYFNVRFYSSVSFARQD